MPPRCSFRLQKITRARSFFANSKEKITAANALKVSGSLKIEGVKSEATLEVSIVVAKENKAKISVDGKSTNNDVAFRLVSDGKKSRIYDGPEINVDRDSPKRLERFLKNGISVEGLMSGFGVFPLLLKNLIDPMQEDLFVASDFTLSADDKIDGRVCKVIKYKSGKSTMTIWMDEKTLLPLKYLSVTESGSKTTALIREFVIDPKIEDSSFELRK